MECGKSFHDSGKKGWCLIASVNIVKSSWLNLTSLLELDGTIFWDQTEFPDVPFSDDDTYIQLSDIQAKRIDLVAFNQYGDSNLMWIIMLANDKYMPNDFFGEETIRIPSRTTVNQILGRQS